MGQELSGSFPDLRSVSTDRGRYIYGLNWIVYAIPNKRDILGSKSLLLAVPNVNFPSIREQPDVAEYLWNTMEHPWNTHGTPMEHLWNTYGTPMEHLWNTYGAPMDHLRMGHLWNSYGTTMEYLWNIYENVCGISVECLVKPKEA